MQSMLDSAKVSIDLQDKILRALFQQVDASEVVNYRGMPLGSLLRHAGTQWDGGPLGIPSLGTFNGLTDAYEVMGAPQPETWRLCIGVENNFHEPKAYGPSTQDNQLLVGAMNPSCRACIQCLTRRMKCRDCDSCSERCDVLECQLQ